MTTRIDARAKVTGRTAFTADVQVPGMCHAALVRSDEPHARIDGIDTSAARAAPGVIGVYTAADVPTTPYGRRVRDIPVLARDRVRFLGERVAAVVAETREQAEAAARLVDVAYAPLPAVFTPDGADLQSCVEGGDRDAAETLLRGSAHVVDRTYATVSAHAGYLEPQACIAQEDGNGRLHLWVADKNPYRLRDEVAHCLARPSETIVVHPVAIGGDFGGKGSMGDAPLCAALAALTGRPVRIALRYWEDLAASPARHPVRMRVWIGCDRNGTLTALWMDALADGGAYAGAKPRPDVDLHGLTEGGSSYRLAAHWYRARIAYTNSVPRGHVRAPGAPQATFAVEAALDELADLAGVPPVEMRRRNLLRDGDADAHGTVWAEARGHITLDAALWAANRDRPPGPSGWLTGTGVAVTNRPAPAPGPTSLRLVRRHDGGVRAEVPVPETGTGSHTVVRQTVARELGIAPERVEVVHVATSDLPYDRGVGGSRVTASLSRAAAAAVAALRSAPSGEGERQRAGGRESERSDEVTVILNAEARPRLTSFCVQVAHVAVDPATGQVDVLCLTTAVDAARVINPTAHRMQIEGGAVMGYGFALLEDLRISDGQVEAATLGDFKLPSIQDAPALRTVVLGGGCGVGPLDVKAVGELGNVPTAAAIANAVADATGVRVAGLPITAEAVWTALAREADPTATGAASHGG